MFIDDLREDHKVTFFVLIPNVNIHSPLKLLIMVKTLKSLYQG